MNESGLGTHFHSGLRQAEFSLGRGGACGGPGALGRAWPRLAALGRDGAELKVGIRRDLTVRFLAAFAVARCEGQPFQQRRRQEI